MAEATRVTIHLRGCIDERWANWFEGLQIEHCPDGTTRLSGPVVDDAALYGLLGKARDLGLSIIQVRRETLSTRPAQAGNPTNDLER